MGEQTQSLFREREVKRWTDSLDAAQVVLLKELHEEEADTTAFIKKERSLQVLTALLHIAIEDASGVVPWLFTETRGRMRWNRYLTGVRFLLTQARDSFVMTHIAPLLKLGEAAEKVMALGTEGLRATHDLQEVFTELEGYMHNWERGEEIMRDYQREPVESEVALYATYTTWERDKSFGAFHDSLQRASVSSFELIIEGPMQLYLMLAESHVMVILRLPILDKMRDVTEDEALVLDDLQELSDAVKDAVRDSRHIPIFHGLLAKTAEQAIASWHKEEAHIRGAYTTEIARRRFVTQFEEGLLFRTSNGE